MKKIAIIGGGASGFFIGSNLEKKLGQQTTIFDQSNLPLQKVKISGGGRCNVSHSCFDPNELINFYPRGKKELKSVFYQFQPSDTMDWFEKRGVSLKIEDDGRIFPVSNNSMSIIECLMTETKKNGLELRLSEGVLNLKKLDNGFEIETKKGIYLFDKVIVTTGSTPKFWKLLQSLDLSIINPVPSLFTFNCNDIRLENLKGISFPHIEIETNKLFSDGPLLITHWGLSGPAVLRLSAWGARNLNELNYKFDIKVNFVNKSYDEVKEILNKKKELESKKQIYKYNFFDFPKRFWISILNYCKIDSHMKFADLSKKQIDSITKELTQGIYKIDGKSTFKDEFVTAGGVDLKEINFKTMESKKHKNLFFAGEVLNIDAITGGFNFQACWSEAYIISNYLNDNQ